MSDTVKVFGVIINLLNSITSTLISNTIFPKQKFVRELLTAYLVIEKIEHTTNNVLSGLVKFQHETHPGKRVEYIHKVGANLSEVELLMRILARWVQYGDSTLEMTVFSSGVMSYIKYLNILDYDELYSVSPVYEDISMVPLKNELQAVRSPSPKLFPGSETVAKISDNIESLLAEIRNCKEALQEHLKANFQIEDFF